MTIVTETSDLYVQLFASATGGMCIGYTGSGADIQSLLIKQNYFHAPNAATTNIEALFLSIVMLILDMITPPERFPFELWAVGIPLFLVLGIVGLLLSKNRAAKRITLSIELLFAVASWIIMTIHMFSRSVQFLLLIIPITFGLFIEAHMYGISTRFSQFCFPTID